MVEDEQERMLWQGVDEAERYLLRGTFTKAQGTAAATLLEATALRKKGASAVLDDVINSCCMVLLQAQHERGRHDELDSQLRKAFSSLETIPCEVFLTWSCLRVKAGDKDGAQAAIVEYLQARGEKLDRRASCSLAGLYALELLCNHRQSSHEAEDWLHEQSEWLDAATMRLLLKKVRRCQRRSPALSKRSVKEPRQNGTVVRKENSASNPSQKPPSLSAPQTTILPPGPNETTHAFSPGQEEPPELEPSPDDFLQRPEAELRVNPSRGWYSWLLYWASLAQGWWIRGWQNGHRKWRQVAEDAGSRSLLLATAAVVFAYALIRERAALRRHLQKISRTCQRTVADLFELAFSYSLNPLAAAAQLGPQTGRSL